MLQGKEYIAIYTYCRQTHPDKILYISLHSLKRLVFCTFKGILFIWRNQAYRHIAMGTPKIAVDCYVYIRGWNIFTKNLIVAYTTSNYGG